VFWNPSDLNKLNRRLMIEIKCGPRTRYDDIDLYRSDQTSIMSSSINSEINI
jgi:hypothetical protein